MGTEGRMKARLTKVLSLLKEKELDLTLITPTMKANFLMEKYMEKGPFTGVTVAAITETTIMERNKAMELLTFAREDAMRENGSTASNTVMECYMKDSPR